MRSEGALGLLLGAVGGASAFRSATLVVLQGQERRTLHCPKSVESWEAPLGLTDVTEIHQRVVGATPRVFDRALPMPDVFERPAGGLVAVLNGMDVHTWSGETPFLGGKLRSEYNAHVEGLKGMRGVAAAYTASTSKPNAGRVVCMSNLAGAESMCAESSTMVNPRSAVLDMERLRAFHEDVREFHPDSQADQEFLAELQAVLELPSYASSRASSGPADTYLLYSNGVDTLAETYGAGSDKVKTARRLMDQAVGQTITAMQEAYGGAFVSQVMLPEKNVPLARRRLYVPSLSGNITNEEIDKVNVITWTAVGLIVVLLMALSLVFSADSGPKDSLLYAKFQADVTGGKMD